MNIKKIKDLFGKFSKEYDKHMSESNHIKIQKKIIDSFLSDINGNILDIATGTGIIARYIKIKKKDLEVFGIDFSKEMISEAKQKSRIIKFRNADVHKIPYPSNYFDVVTCSYGFYWFKNINKVLKEIKRILKPKGNLLILEEEFNKRSIPKPKFSKKRGYLLELANQENYTGVEFLKAIIKKMGFVLLKEKRLLIDKDHDTIGIVFSNDKSWRKKHEHK